MTQLDLWDRFVDRHSAELATAHTGPTTVALVVGVSSYPALRKPTSAWKMAELDSAASSALEFAEWMNEEFDSDGTPLRSLHVLLSPTKGEADRLQGRLGDAPRANRENVKAALAGWVTACRKSRGGTAVLYFAGHGVFQSKSGSNLLLEDLSGGDPDANPDLDASLDLSPIVKGLGQLGLKASWTFVDACQATLRKDAHFGPGGLSFPYTETDRDQRTGWYVYSAASEGTLAYGKTGGRSVFIDALLEALRREAVERDTSGKWVVNSDGLSRILATLASHPHQEVWPHVEGATLPFHTLAEPPLGRLTVTITPSDFASSFDVSVVDDAGQANIPRSRLEPHPLDVQITPGVWVVRLYNDDGRAFRPELRAPEVRPFQSAIAEFET